MGKPNFSDEFNRGAVPQITERGYRTPLGRELHPEIVIGNKAHTRTAMADLLRQYAASLRLG